MATFTAADAEAAAERLTVEHQAVFESLMRLEDHLGRKLLESAALDGAIRERRAEVRYGFATLWTLYETYRAAVLRVHAIRARRSYPTRVDLEEIQELVTGAVTVALPNPDGSPEPLRSPFTLDELVAEFRTAYTEVCEVVSEAKALAAELSELGELRRHAQAHLDLVETTFAEAAGLHRQACDERHWTSVKIHGMPVPDLAVPWDEPAPRLAAARELCQRGAWQQLAMELAALERDADATLQQARTELADSSRPRRERAELRGRLGAYRAKAAALGRIEDLALEQLYRRARDLLWSAPCDLAIASAAVAEYQSAVNATAATNGGQR